MKNKIIIILIIISVSIIYYSKTIIDRKNFLQKSLKEKLDNEIKISTLKDKLYYTSIINNNKMLDITTLVNFKDTTVRLGDVIKPNILIFKFSEFNCNTCVDKQIELITKWKKKSKTNNVLIITKYNNIRDFIIFKRLNSLDNILILNLKQPLNIGLEEDPFFFTINKTLEVNDFFIPIKEKPNRTLDYLNAISKKHF